MLRHIVAWNLMAGFTDEENKATAQKIKSELEGLANCVEGIVKLKVYTDMIGSSNRHVVLDSVFESEAALEAYQVHPEHQRVAAFVRSVTEERACVDFWE
ncbi:MAG: Dabb family protein [Defluviitaleaceae bacterium]|nr:Dabb family protein [Defluviitaleaceae bacterium]